MDGVLETVLKMSCLGVLTSCMLLPLKYVLQKCLMPRRILFLLWAIIGLRLICPVALQSQMSIFNLTGLFEREEENVERQYDITLTEEIILPADEVGDKDDWQKMSLWVYIYFAGVFIVLMAGACDYIRYRHKLRFAVKKDGNVYTSDEIEAAFVMGIVKPKIYIPDGTSDEEYECIVAHEKMHIQRGDYIIKIIAYIIFAAHWFNPCVWLLFGLFSEDMELVCDECTILALGDKRKDDYISSLLNYGKGKKLYFYSVGFSASGLKKRCICVKNIRRCNRVVSSVAVVICVLSGFVMGTDAVGAVDGVIYEEATEIYEAESESVKPETEEAGETITESVIAETEGKPEKRVVEKKKEREKIEKHYSYKTNLASETDNVYCDEHGSISISFDLNAEIFLWVRLYETGADKPIESTGILANNSTVHTFTDCDKDKSYRITLESPLGDAWKIEGSYTVY